MIPYPQQRGRSILFLIVLIAAGGLLHGPQFKKDLVGFHVWRQTQTQNTIHSFAFEDGNILNPRRNDRGADDGIFRMEFPIMQWIISKPVKWGADEIRITRICCYILSMIGVGGFFYLLWILTSELLIAGIGAFIFLFCPLMFYYSINPLPDMFALTVSVWGLAFLVQWKKTGGIWFWLGGVILLMVGALSKLPFILYFAFPIVMLVAERKRHKRKLVIPLVILAISALPVLMWYGWVIPTWEGNGIISGIFSMTPEQKSDYVYFAWFHLRTTLPELLTGLPAFVFFMVGIIVFFRWKMRYWRSYLPWMITVVAILGYLLFELNMIQKVHDYYFLPLLPFVLLVCIMGFKRMEIHKKSWIKTMGFILLMLIPVYSYFRIVPRWDRIGFNEDLLRYKNELRSAVPKDALVMVGNDPSHHIFLYYIDHKGWAFENNWLTEKELKEAIASGCEYLYTDSKLVSQNSKFQTYFGTVVATFNTISVIHLVLPDNE